MSTQTTTDLAARFEAKREECEEKAQNARFAERTLAWQSQAEAFREARDMARADAAGPAILPSQVFPAQESGYSSFDGKPRSLAQDERPAMKVLSAAPPPAQQGSSSPLREGETVGELERLSAAATSGAWLAEEAGRITATGTSPGYDIPVWGTILTAHDTKDIEDGVTHWSTDGARQGNARYVAALVNAHRVGHLAPASLATARDGGTGAETDDYDGERLLAVASRRVNEDVKRLGEVAAMFDPLPAYVGEIAAKTRAERAAAATPTPDPRKEALAVLEGLDARMTPEQHIRRLREGADDAMEPYVATAFYAQANRIEAALATLGDTDQAGEVRHGR